MFAISIEDTYVFESYWIDTPSQRMRHGPDLKHVSSALDFFEDSLDVDLKRRID